MKPDEQETEKKEQLEQKEIKETERKIIEKRKAKKKITGTRRQKRIWSKKKICVIAGIILILIFACDMRMKTVVYTIETDKLEEPLRLVLITDLHSCYYGKEQTTLIQAVEEQNPDIVLLGGDIFDDVRSYENSETTIKYLAEEYRCYYVTGNHEYWSEDISTILHIVDSYGITILEGECDTIEVRGEKINICGVDDPDVTSYTKNAKSMPDQLAEAQKQAEPDCYTVLLSHRPEYAETYMKYDFDLVLSGHAHGGQWRIPGILNGLYAPNQGLFPKYVGGLYEFESGTMIVSRGLARESTLAPRIFNRPELVVIDLQ